MRLESFEIQHVESQEKKENIEEIVKKVMDIHRLAAAKYLPEGKLRNQVIKFYSDPDRLSKELANVFRNMDEQKVEDWMREREKLTSDEELFVEFANTKSYATNLEERKEFESHGR
jgi:hypothetical protein